MPWEAVLSGPRYSNLCSVLHCLTKINDHIIFEPRTDSLCVYCQNDSHSASAQAIFPRSHFIHVLSRTLVRQFKIANKVLLPIFHRASEYKVDSCKLNIDERQKVVKLTVTISLSSGIKKTYIVAAEDDDYRAARPLSSASYARKLDACRNRLVISALAIVSKCLFHFSSRTEEIRFRFFQRQVRIEGVTRKITNSTKVLRLPVHTTIDLDVHQFDLVSVQAGSGLTHPIREFKALASLAERERNGCLEACIPENEAAVYWRIKDMVFDVEVVFRINAVKQLPSPEDAEFAGRVEVLANASSQPHEVQLVGPEDTFIVPSLPARTGPGLWSTHSDLVRPGNGLVSQATMATQTETETAASSIHWDVDGDAYEGNHRDEDRDRQSNEEEEGELFVEEISEIGPTQPTARKASGLFD